MAAKNQFFTKHAKSSAAVVTIALHAILIIVAISFVAVSVIQKQEKKFEAKTVNRPQMQLKKLQVPVDIKKKRPKPKLRKRIVATPKMSQNLPDIQMPEISGVAGGVGNAGGDGIGGGSLGFSMPEIELFGIKGKGRGEKIVVILDAGNDMMLDQMGGAKAYTIIKEEMIRILDGLPSASLFNVIVYSGNWGQMAFPKLSPATDDNIQHLKDWLMPLNNPSLGRSSYGLKSLGKGGTPVNELVLGGKLADTKKVGAAGDLDLRQWSRQALYAQKLQADTIFVLCTRWENQRVPTSKGQSREEWDQTANGKRWNTAYQQALKTLEEENRRRRAAGEPDKKINRDEWSMSEEYYPNLEKPPQPDWYSFTPRDIAEAFVDVREKHKPAGQATSGLSKRDKFSFNVVRFTPKGGDSSEWRERRAAQFNELTSLCNGDYKTVNGMAAIQNLVK